MAHSDVLIFLTNVTWMFFIFLFLYFFFVLFFLPSFYKKLRLFVVSRAELSFLGVYFSSLLPAGIVSGWFFCKELKSHLYVFGSLVGVLVAFVFSTKISEMYLATISLFPVIASFDLYLFDGRIGKPTFLVSSNNGYFFS